LASGRSRRTSLATCPALGRRKCNALNPFAFHAAVAGFSAAATL
jgi:hypothetical protein